MRWLGLMVTVDHQAAPCPWPLPLACRWYCRFEARCCYTTCPRSSLDAMVRVRLLGDVHQQAYQQVLPRSWPLPIACMWWCFQKARCCCIPGLRSPLDVIVRVRWLGLMITSKLTSKSSLAPGPKVRSWSGMMITSKPSLTPGPCPLPAGRSAA